MQPNQHVAEILGSEIAVVTEVAKYLQLIHMLVMNLENINKVAAKNLSIDEVVAMKDTIHLLVHDLTIIKEVYSNLDDIKRATEYGVVISEMQSFLPILKETVDRALEVDANLRQTQALYNQMVELAATARMRYDQLATTNNNVGSTMTLALEPAGSTRFFMTLNKPTTTVVLAGEIATTGLTNRTWECTLFLKQGTGANKVTWPAGIKWAGGRVPVLSFEAGRTDVITLMSTPTLGEFYGFYDGAWL